MKIEEFLIYYFFNFHNMIEYLVVGFCFLALILVRMYLFYRTYDNKMKYYSEPKDLAKEFYDNLV